MPNRAALHSYWAKFKAQHYRDVEVIVALVFDDVPKAGFSNFVIYLIRIKDHFRLYKHSFAEAEVCAKLGAKFHFIHTKVEGCIAAADNNILGSVYLRIHSAFEAEREKLCLCTVTNEK